MFATKEGRYQKPFQFRFAIVWALVASVFVGGLTFYKKAAMQKLAEAGVENLKLRHPKVAALFQASFYFFYDDQFVPGVREFLAHPGPSSGAEEPQIQQLVILSNNGSVIFDSAQPSPKGSDKNSEKNSEIPYPDPDVLEQIGSNEPVVFVRGFQVRILMPGSSGEGRSAELYKVLYVLDARSLRTRILLIFASGILLGLILWRMASTVRLFRFYLGTLTLWKRFWKLRVKFLFTIVLINAVTAVIVFYTLTSMQTREQTERIEKESVLFGQFSTGRVISDFTNFFYFYYSERFLPEVRSTIASNENLVGIRIVSHRNSGVLFDSEQAASGAGGKPLAASGPSEVPKADFSQEVEEQLRSRDLATRYFYRNGERLLSVITTYRNESQALFWVEYLFSFRTLARSIQAIRQQILLDLIPSIGLSLLIAIVFSQLLISPIRRLMAALRSVAAGDYNVLVDVRNSDEIGELAHAFNTMTSELKRKKELRKYLSDATYRQVMKATEGQDGLRIGSTRVEATVLFTDIRDFVAHCESMDAEEVTAMLNEYFSEMVEVVYKHGGEVDKFIGDAFLAVFYAGEESRFIQSSNPRQVNSSATALQAVYCSLEMRERLADFNERRREKKVREIETGIGITHGEIISGPIGAKDRMDFTVIGDVVNLASRIEKLSKAGSHTKIVFSHQVEERIRGLLDYVEFSREKVRGKNEEVLIYELVGIREIDALIKNLGSTDVALRRRSIELLGQSRNLAALPHVIEMLQDPDESTRIASILAISKLAPKDDPLATRALLDRIEKEKSEKILPTLISGFGRICSSQKVFNLVPFLDSSNDRIVANTIEALGQIRDPKAMDLVLPKLYSRNNRIKANAAMALFAAGHVEVIDTLKPMLMHSDPLMRSSAAFAIGELTSIAEPATLIKSWQAEDGEGGKQTKVFLAELQECVPMLVALLKDKDIAVRRQSVVALGKIKDKSAVLPLIDLVDPVQNSKELNRDIQEALRAIGSHKLVREVISRLTQ
jgi:class 3 adenylate cyclase/HEAT repeat protein